MRKNSLKPCVVMLVLMILVFVTGCGSSADNQNVGENQRTEENQTMDFSGEWSGIQLLAEISGPDAQPYQEMEGMTLDSRLILSLPNKSTGTAQLYFVDDLAGPALNASVVQDRLTLLGELWGDPFEWNGTFEYDDTAGEWTLTGGGDITGTEEDVVFHIVLSLNQASLGQTASAQADPSQEIDGPGSELFGPPIEGEPYETEKVSMVIPDGWNVMDIAGGLQAYQGNNAVEVWVRGSGVTENAAKAAMEGMVKDYNGTPIETFEHWGLTFYSTTFEMFGSEQFKMSAVKDGERVEIGLAIHSSADGATEDLMFGMMDTIILK